MSQTIGPNYISYNINNKYNDFGHDCFVVLTPCRGDQGKLSHFSIKPTKKPMHKQIRENEYCIGYKKYLHISVSNMNCTGLAIITWWAFKKIENVAQLAPALG